MKKLIKKIFAKNEYYDDLLGEVITENKFKVWSIRIVLMVIPVLFLILLAGSFF